MDQASFLHDRLVMQVEGTAEWRTEKAVECPHDADRNLGAAKELSPSPRALRTFPRTIPLWRGYAAAIETGEPVRLTELLSETVRRTGLEFLQEIISEARKVAAETV